MQLREHLRASRVHKSDPARARKSNLPRPAPGKKGGIGARRGPRAPSNPTLPPPRGPLSTPPPPRPLLRLFPSIRPSPVSLVTFISLLSNCTPSCLPPRVSPSPPHPPATAIRRLPSLSLSLSLDPSRHSATAAYNEVDVCLNE